MRRKRCSGICVFRRLPAELAAIVFEYSPLYLWPLAVKREDVMKRLVLSSLPTKKSEEWTDKHLGMFIQGSWMPDLDTSFYSEGYFHEIILALIRYSSLLSVDNLKTAASSWKSIGAGIWSIDLGFSQPYGWMVIPEDLGEVNVDVLPQGYEMMDLKAAMKTELGYEASGGEKESDTLRIYLRWTMRDCISSLFGLLEWLGVDPYESLEERPLYAWLGIWRVPLERVRAAGRRLQEGKKDECRNAVRDVCYTLDVLFRSQYSLFQTPGFKRVKDECVAILREARKIPIYPPLFPIKPDDYFGRMRREFSEFFCPFPTE